MSGDAARTIACATLRLFEVEFWPFGMFTIS
jgi:hypothetical protein